jgi:hypothetical protein
MLYMHRQIVRQRHHVLLMYRCVGCSTATVITEQQELVTALAYAGQLLMHAHQCMCADSADSAWYEPHAVVALKMVWSKLAEHQARVTTVVHVQHNSL